MTFSIEVFVEPGTGPGYPWRHETAVLVAGRSPDCQLIFAGPTHDVVSGRHLQLDWGPQGLRLADLGSSNGTYLNGQRVLTPRPVQSGDWIQLGETGPRFRIERCALAVAGTRLEPRPPQLVAAPPGRAPSGGAGPNYVLWGAGATLLLTAALVVFALGTFVGPRRTSSAPSAPPGGADLAPAEGAADASPAQPPPSPPPRAGGGAPAADSPAVPGAAAGGVARAGGDAPPAVAESMAAVYLLVAQHPSGKITSAVVNACAIGGRRLLTTGVGANDLASLKGAGWTLEALDPRTGRHTAVESLRVHRGFGDANVPPEQRLYFDQGVVELAEPVAHVAALATLDDRQGLVDGAPVYCLGFQQELGTRITNSDQPEVVCRAGKIFALTALDESPAAPRLLHTKGDWSDHLRGGALVSASGRLLGIFAVSTPEGAPLSLHYAPMPDPQLLPPGGGPLAEAAWIEPVPQPLPAGEPPPAGEPAAEPSAGAEVAPGEGGAPPPQAGPPPAGER